jgi:truncated hemoglobin YjbI
MLSLHAPLGINVMTFYEQVFGHEAAAAERAASLFNSVKSLTKGIARWLQSCADYWAAAALYESLHSLSEAELLRRGLSRDTLARDVFQSDDRVARS